MKQERYPDGVRLLADIRGTNARFESKGRLSARAARIPTRVIAALYPALSGASALLSRHLANPGQATGHAAFNTGRLHEIN